MKIDPRTLSSLRTKKDNRGNTYIFDNEDGVLAVVSKHSKYHDAAVALFTSAAHVLVAAEVAMYILAGISKVLTKDFELSRTPIENAIHALTVAIQKAKGGKDAGDEERKGR